MTVVFHTRAWPGRAVLRSYFFQGDQDDFPGASQTDGKTAPDAGVVADDKGHAVDIMFAPCAAAVEGSHQKIESPDHAAVGMS